MSSYLLTALAWLGAYRVPVVVLSATLPAGRRQEILNAYTGSSNEAVRSLAYPLITSSCNGIVSCDEVELDESRAREVSLRRISDEELADELASALSDGGIAGVIVNTVGRAQEKYQELAAKFGKEHVCLLHARLLAGERSKLEDRLALKLGPPHKAKRPEKLILVGTQVLEQSLDFDFDILVSDLCPMDLLLQRIGRLHRHPRERKKKLRSAVCLVLGASESEFEKASELIYGDYLLMRTRALLPEKLSLPGDIPILVAGVYDEEDSAEFAEASRKWSDKQTARGNRAEEYQISLPDCGEDNDTLLEWLDRDADDSEKRGEAAVRDGDESIEVIVVRQHKGELYLIDEADPIPSGIPGEELASRIAAQTVRLPSVIGKWNIDTAIHELEETMKARKLNVSWYASPLLKGSLCLIIDDDLGATIGGVRFTYDQVLGLCHKKEE
jgi:CRISPR-associated endonuclease/helicase Cas3